MQKLYIFTLHWNEKEKIERLYKSLIPSIEMFNWKWFIKENGSNDGSIEYLSSIKNDNIEILFCGHNRDSFSTGMNKLFELAKPEDDDLILLLNNDLWFGDTKSIKEISSLMKEDVGVVGARILYPNSNRLQHAGVCFVKKYNYLPYHYRYNEISDKTAETTREFQAITGAVFLTKAKYYKEICKTNKSGRVGFDEKFFWAFEDIDACLQIKNFSGKKIMYCGKTLIYHEESATLKKNPVNKIMMPQNVKYFKEKWQGKYKLED